MINVLLIEDNPGDARLIFEMVANKSEITITHVSRLVKGIEEINAKCFDITLLDLSLPDSYGLDTLTRMKVAAPHTPIIVLTGLDDDSIAELAVQAGAQDYLPKGQLDASLLLRSIRYSLERNQLSVDLERKVIERTHELQELNAALETKVLERTRELQELNTILEEEIAERQAAEESLRESRDALAASEAILKNCVCDLEGTNKELQNFAYIIAHDFRTPMVNLKGFAKELGYSLTDLKKIIQGEAVFSSEKANRKAAELFERDVPDALHFIDVAVDRLERMVAALLTLAREGKREIIYKQIDCSELVREILRSFELQIIQKGIQIEIGPLPTIETDQLTLEHIFSNLLDNAIKYLDSDRPGKINISYSDNGEENVFSVKDNGRGISGEEQENIFDIFKRAGKQDVPGEGMGLAYVKTQIRRLGGRIWCESMLGIGTKMSIAMPKKYFDKPTNCNL